MAAAAALGTRAARGAAAGRMAAWRAHAYGAPAELRLETARVPPLRAPDDVLVRVHHASINPLDIAMIGGYGSRVLNALRALEGQDVEFPLVVGRDFAGEVAAAGASASVSVGERVWGVVPAHRSGSHAQYVLVKDRWVGAAPRALSGAAAGGALYAALSACAVVRAAGLRPGAGPAGGPGGRAPRVLLLGLGGAGHAALQLLVHQGAQVVVGCSAELAGAARAAGAAAALDRAATDYDAALLDHGPYDAIVDCAGLGGGEAGARRWRFGRFATLTSPLLRETDARGLALGAGAAAAALAAQCAALPPPPAPPACAPRVRWAYFMPSRDDIEMLRRLAERGKFSVRVEREYGWRAAGAAYARAAAGRARGKLVLDFTRDDHGNE